MGLGERLRAAMDKLQKGSALDKETVKEGVRELQRALISADVEINTVLSLSREIEKEAFGDTEGQLSRREHVTKLVYDKLVDILGGRDAKAPEAPARVLLLGLFGNGKTTTAGKLAAYYQKRGKTVGLVCADAFRPAAYEQLKQVAEQAGARFYGNPKEKDASTIVQEGLEKLEGTDIVIVDSAGRSALDDTLTREIKGIQNVLKAPHVWLVMGADVGQLAKKQAAAFHETVGVNGIIVTRMDGSAKGGGALAACRATGAPVYFLGTGEKKDDLEAFDADRYLGRIMGYGDLAALLEKAKDAGPSEMSPEEILSGRFTLKTFYEQLKAAKKMGPLNKIAEMMGLSMQLPKEMLETGQDKLDGYKVLMDSMTPEELDNPEVMNKSRMARIAKGAGKKESDVRELVKQYKQMKGMFKQFKRMGDINDPSQLQGGKFNKMLQKMAAKKQQKKFKVR